MDNKKKSCLLYALATIGREMASHFEKIHWDEEDTSYVNDGDYTPLIFLSKKEYEALKEWKEEDCPIISLI